MRWRLSTALALILALTSILTPSVPAHADSPAQTPSFLSRRSLPKLGVYPTISAQGSQQADAAANPFLILYPALREAPTPAWLRPGLRVSYNFMFATFARNIDDPTPSGSALLQYDVIAQDRRSVVVIPTSYNTQIVGQPPTALGYQVGLPGLGDFWFAPQVLADAEAAAYDQFLVNRLSVEVEGETYNVVRMQSNTDGGEEVWEFEASTGLLVFHRQTLYDAAGNQTNANILTLLGSRQLKLPWRFGSVPTWVKTGAEIDLQGSQMMDLGGPPYISLPMAATLRVIKANALWSEHWQTTWLNNRQISQNIGATGVAQIFGGLWLPPEALGVLKPGAVLDRDPLTGFVTRVEGATAREISISAQSPSVITRCIYDTRTGRLTGYYQEAHMLAGTQYTELTAR